MSDKKKQEKLIWDPTAHQQEVVAPFKPFTCAEVADVCRVPAKLLDQFVEAGILSKRHGDDGESEGLDISAAFAVYCARRWQEEGSGAERAERVIAFVVGLGYERVVAEANQGNTFPEFSTGLLVPAPLSRIGAACNFLKLNGEFRVQLCRVFPKKVSVSTFEDSPN
jgi:hypothetical protein